MAADSALLESFPAVLQALTARALEVSALSESFVADLADAVTAATSAGQAKYRDLADFKVESNSTLVRRAQQQHCRDLQSGGEHNLLHIFESSYNA